MNGGFDTGTVNPSRRRPSAGNSALVAMVLMLGLAVVACPSSESNTSQDLEASDSETANSKAPSRERYTRRFTIQDPEPWHLESKSWEPEPPTDRPMAIYEVSQFAPSANPTRMQKKKARRLVKNCEKAVLEHGWESFEKAKADGFVPHRNRNHFYNEAHLLDARIMDPDHPEFLMYYDTPNGKRLVGFMFYVRSLTERGPQFAGPLSIWHYHKWKYESCMKHNLISSGPARNSAASSPCPRGFRASTRSPEMIHVWLVARPDGPFSTRMHIAPDELKKVLEKRDLKLQQGRRTRAK